MARPKKVEEKPAAGKIISINIEAFVRTRDSVVTGLATLQDAIHTLSNAYITHTNAVLGEHGAGLDVQTALARLGENPLITGLEGLNAAISPAKSPAPDAKKEKKKRVHDPNAPKRPLTPYFLYMQTARPIIAADLGPDVAKGAVSDEGVARWNAMEGGDKQLWTQAYTDNLKLYNARMHSYKAGNVAAKDMSDEDAAQYAEENNIGLPAIEPTADGQLTAEALNDGPLPEEVETPKTPKAKATGGRKAKGKAAIESTPIAQLSDKIVPPSSAIVPPSAKATPSAVAAAAEVTKEKSPDRKRKRAAGGKKGKDAEEASLLASIEKEDAVTETPKAAAEKKSRKKKAKTDA